MRVVKHPHAAESPLRIAFVVGSLPPDLCGVGHYTERLASALADRGHDVAVLVAPAGTRHREVSARVEPGTIVHVEYPTVGIGRSLQPLRSLLATRRSVLTVHEYTLAHPLRKATILALVVSSRRVVFTTEAERIAVAHFAPIRSRSTVIPIGSGIATVASSAVPDLDVTYFGLLGPDKGLETFLAAASTSARRGDQLRFAVVGGWLPSHEQYIRELMGRSSHLPVRWMGPLDEHELSLALSRAQFAYLPFPDGASERRSSLLATLGHGVPTITTEGPATTDALRRAVTFASSPDDVGMIVRSFSDAERERMRREGLAVAAEHSWTRVAELHEAVYLSLPATRS
jgi:glycosyltransferase involved in cell wall biosynthesis